MGGNASLGAIIHDWNEPARVVKIDVLQDKAAQLGITSESISTALDRGVGGSAETQVRDGTLLADGADKDGATRAHRSGPLSISEATCRAFQVRRCSAAPAPAVADTASRQLARRKAVGRLFGHF